VLSNLRCDLAIGHLVHGFDGKDVCFKSFVLKTFFQLTFGLAGAKDLDRVCVTNNSGDLIVIAVEMVRKFSVSLVF